MVMHIALCLQWKHNIWQKNGVNHFITQFFPYARSKPNHPIDVDDEVKIFSNLYIGFGRLSMDCNSKRVSMRFWATWASTS